MNALRVGCLQVSNGNPIHLISCLSVCPDDMRKEQDDRQLWTMTIREPV